MQLKLGFPAGWGGKRKNAGRKPAKGAKHGVVHGRRPGHRRTHPVHVTMRAVRGLPSLRSFLMARALGEGLHAAKRDGRRITQFSIQADHIHFIVEADDRDELLVVARGTAIRMAKRLNRALGRHGKVFVDRYHARALTMPTTMRAALVYVLQNWRHHEFEADGVDPLSSGRWFDGWRTPLSRPLTSPPVSPSQTWLGDKGWRRKGLLRLEEGPGPHEG